MKSKRIVPPAVKNGLIKKGPLPLFTALTNVNVIRNVFAGFTVDKAVVPGEPIPVTLFFWSFNGALDFGTGCLIKIFLVAADGSGKKTEIFRTPDDGTFLPYLPSPQNLPDIGVFKATIPPPSSATALGKNIYAFGDHQLTMEISTNGKDAGPYVDTSILTVIPEAIDSSWWIWSDLNYRTGVYDPAPFYWKEDYTLSGFCFNKTIANIGLNFNVTLLETDDTGSVTTHETISETLPAITTVENGGAPVLFFQPIKQEWTWLADAVWLVVGPLHRTFVYNVKVDVRDDYGNPYQFLSTPLALTVNVSDKKQKLQESAAATGFGAIASTIISIFVPWAGIVAGASGTASQVLGAYAKDPPEADKEFLKIVAPDPFLLPKQIQADSRLKEFGDFIRGVHEMVNGMMALSKVEGKLMGAQLKNNEEGIRLQKQSYKEIINRILKTADKLSGITETATLSLLKNGILQQDDGKPIVTGKKKISPERLSGQLRKVGLGKRVLPVAIEISKDPKKLKMILSEDGLIRLFRLASLPLINVAYFLQAETVKVLGKYKIAKK